MLETAWESRWLPGSLKNLLVDFEGTKQVWQPKHSHADNHYLDAEVYALAAADIMGVRTLHLSEDQQEQHTAINNEPETPEEQWIKAHDNWIGG